MKRERRKERDAFAVACERIEYAMRQHDNRHVRTDAPAIQIGVSAQCDKRNCRGRSERKEHGMSYRSMAAEHRDVAMAKWASDRVDIGKRSGDGGDTEQPARDEPGAEKRAEDKRDRCVGDR